MSDPLFGPLVDTAADLVNTFTPELHVPLAFQSSFLSSGEYNPAAMILSVTFKDGTSQDYHGVTPDTVAGFMAASSQGAYFNAHIRNA